MHAGRHVDPEAHVLLERHGAQILATARRYSACHADAEDAFQRAFEILLRKRPPADDRSLVPWLKTVVKHEALTIRRERDRHSPLTHDGEPSEPPTPVAITHDQAERREQLSHGAEALGQLKPQEVRALVLRAEGYSYREICELTGWSYTKVNRALAEGRRAFTRRLEGIHAGAECERLAPRLSALADGEATPDDLAALRPHLRSCLSCRARLKQFRATPGRVAALLPPVAFAPAVPSGSGTLRGLLESALGALQQKSAALGERAHAAVELATGQKVAAVAASAAALAGGGAAADQLAQRPEPQRVAEEVQTATTEAQSLPETTTETPTPVEPAVDTTAQNGAATPEPEPVEPAPDPANEFDPGGAGAVTSATAQPAQSSAEAAGTQSQIQTAPAQPSVGTPSTSGLAAAPTAPVPSGGGAGGGGEFAP